MPNWCENELRITGKPERVQAVVAAITDEEGNLDFNRVIPQPPSLDMDSGSAEIPYKILFRGEFGDSCWDGVEAVIEALENDYHPERVAALNGWLRKKGAPTTEEVRAQEKLAIAYNDNVVNHGHTTWYGWRQENWGCKWNASESDSHTEATKTGVRTTFAFQTPWSPPEPVFKAIVERFPGVRLSLRFWECGVGFKGCIRGAKGVVISETTSEYRGSRGG